MEETKDLTINESQIKKTIQSENPISVVTYTLPREFEVFVEQITIAFLKLAEQEKLKDYIFYCIQELMGNAKKANTKRVYFAEKNLDMHHPDDYREGMASFKETTISNISYYLKLQEKKGLYIKLILQIRQNVINVEVRNNSEATEFELNLVNKKLERAKQFTSLEEALTQILDDSEGAGLGIVILVLMLKNIGLSGDSFEFTTDNTETIAKIKIPLDKTRAENLSVLANTIVESVNSLPKFPENIIKLQKLINDPQSTIFTIANVISRDPVLTADILKIVNSAHYMVSKRVDNIPNAVKMIGMKGIFNLLYAYGTQKILGVDTPAKKSLWGHCYKSAFLSQHLARRLSKNQNLIDDSYTGGMLHDMGKIIFFTKHPVLLERIKSFCIERNFPASTLEDLSAGMNHAEIGSLIAEKWNFPNSLVAAIRYHHDPASAPDEHKDLVAIVYLANRFCSTDVNYAKYSQIDSGVLKRFNIVSQDQYENLLKNLLDTYAKENQEP